MDEIKAIAVFSGSAFGNDDLYREAAAKLGREIAERSITLVYGGGYCGLMGTVAETVYERGGKVIGVLPETMNTESVTKKRVESELMIVPDMHERKRTMYSLSDAFIALPGGIGTMEELMEIYTWRQLGIHECNIGLLNVKGYWNPLLDMLDKAVSEGFLSKEVKDILIVESEAGKLVEMLGRKAGKLPAKLG